MAEVQEATTYGLRLPLLLPSTRDSVLLSTSRLPPPVGEGDEAEAARHLRQRVAHNDAVHDLAALAVEGAQSVVGGGDREAADEQLAVLLRVQRAIAGVSGRVLLLLLVVAMGGNLNLRILVNFRVLGAISDAFWASETCGCYAKTCKVLASSTKE